MARRLAGRVVVATHNDGKLAEFRALLAPHGIEAVAAGALGLPEPVESGTMFEENAALKARAAAAATGLPAIGDDSGLCVALLDGAPGLFTADWAGRPRDWQRAMERVRHKLAARGHATCGAAAHFVAALVVAWPNGEEAFFEGRCHGHLAWPPRGPHGHGYDPIFVPAGETRTFAEMGEEEKNRLSHRARAFARLAAACLATEGSPP